MHQHIQNRLYRYLLRPVLFLLNPEIIHDLVYTFVLFLQKLTWVSRILQKFYTLHEPSLQKTVMGLPFNNPVGIAAGFDKNGALVDGLACFGFGFVEIGTVTPEPQPGNPKPRLFRLPKDQALINRMGFNNPGMDKVAGCLRKRKTGIIVGGNIGKNKVTPNPQAENDYLKCFDTLYDQVDYFVVNVSSPNTPGLRELQEKGPLEKLLASLMKLNIRKGMKPVLLKIAPDLSLEQLDEIIGVVIKTRLAGVVAANTTLSREGLNSEDYVIKAAGEGGLSGKPLFSRALDMVKYLREKLGPGFEIIGAGGIMSPENASRMMEAGADLVEVYTGFIYNGPSFAKDINRYLANPARNSHY